jgi:nitrogen PTS system EIIA component
VKIQDLIEPEDVYLDLDASELPQALEAVAEHVAQRTGLKARSVVDCLLEREALGSTSVGDAFAIPHCKIANLHGIKVSLARFSSPVNFVPSGEEKVRFVFVVLSPPDQPAAHLKVLSQIARLLKRSEVRRRLLDAGNVQEVLDVLDEVAQAEGL